jgi:hypothetical protein
MMNGRIGISFIIPHSSFIVFFDLFGGALTARKRAG